MTISSTPRTAGPFVGNGVTAAFPFAFKVFARSDLVVAATLASSGAETIQVLDSDYAVTLNADQNVAPGGVITFAVAPVSGVTIAMTSDMPLTQTLELTNNGGFYPKVINDAFDRVVIMIQQLLTRVLRTLQVPIGDTAPSLTMPAAGARAGNLLGFDTNGSPIALAMVAQSATALETALAGSGGASQIGYGGGTVQSTLDGLSQKALLLIVDGQSNAARRAPRVSFSYPPKLACFGGANESIDRTDGLALTTALPASVFGSVIPFSEFGVASESTAPGFAAADTAYRQILTHTPARGGYHYRELMSGTGPWADLYNAITFGRPILLGAGASSVDTVMVLDQGEADADALPPGGSGNEGPITEPQYLAVLRDLVANANRTAALAHKTPGYRMTILAVQTCTCQGLGWRNVQSAQVDAARTVSGFYLAGPRYAYPYEGDGTHLTGYGRRLMGEYCALRLADIAAGAALPVHIASASRVGAVITANFVTVSGNLVIDTATVPDTGTAYPGSLYGFEFYYAGAQIAVNSVTVTGKTATIVLASVPAGAGELRYAQMTWPAGLQTVTGINSKVARGCIRDSGARVAKFDGTVLYNWTCAQTIATN